MQEELRLQHLVVDPRGFEPLTFLVPFAGQRSTEILSGPCLYSIPCAIVLRHPQQSPSVHRGLLSNVLSA